MIHIKDGSGYGGSSHPMHFIYQFQRELKLKQIISDRDLFLGNIDFNTIEAGLQEYYNFQIEQNFFNRTNEMVSKRIFEAFNINLAPFKGWKQKTFSLPANDLSRFNNNRDPLFIYSKGL